MLAVAEIVDVGRIVCVGSVSANPGPICRRYYSVFCETQCSFMQHYFSRKQVKLVKFVGSLSSISDSIVLATGVLLSC